MGLPFEEKLVWADETDLNRSPMGKVPYLDTPQGPLCESAVILEYLEQQPAKNLLLPSDAYQACKVREIATIIDIHVELVARNLYSEAFFGGKISQEVREKTATLLEKGTAALVKLSKFSPFVAGQMLTLADCSAVVHLPVISAASQIIYGKDFLGALPLDAYMQTMTKRPSLQKIHADRQANMELLVSRIKARS